MRFIAGSVLTGFSLLAKVLEGFGGGAGREWSGREWSVGMYVPVGIQVLIWFFMALGVALMLWGIMDILRPREVSE